MAKSKKPPKRLTTGSGNQAKSPVRQARIDAKLQAALTEWKKKLRAELLGGS